MKQPTGQRLTSNRQLSCQTQTQIMPTNESKQKWKTKLRKKGQKGTKTNLKLGPWQPVQGPLSSIDDLNQRPGGWTTPYQCQRNIEFFPTSKDLLCPSTTMITSTDGGTPGVGEVRAYRGRGLDYWLEPVVCVWVAPMPWLNMIELSICLTGFSNNNNKSLPYYFSMAYLLIWHPEEVLNNTYLT